MQKLLHNRYILYVVFLIALIDFLYLGSMEDMTSISVFVCVGIVTGFFSKNMIVILSLTVIITNVLKYGGINNILVKEGFTDEEDREDEDREDEDREDEEKEDSDSDSEERKIKGNKGKDEDDNSGKTTRIRKIVKIKAIGKESEIEPDAEESAFAQVDKQPIDDQERMLMANEKLLERMNKYKPLLDTLQGITKNIAVVKSMTVSEKSE